MEDLDFYIGDEALAAARGHGYGIHYPVRHGIIENWDLMEKYWEQCIFKYLRAEPEDHCFLLVSLYFFYLPVLRFCIVLSCVLEKRKADVIDLFFTSISSHLATK